MVLRVLLAASAAATAGRMVWAGAVELAPDEAYYWLWSRAPAMGYRDHPPLVAWMEALVPTAMGAVSPAWVRLPVILLGAFMPLAAYLLIRAAGASRASALPAALAGAFCPAASAGAVILTPDAPLTMVWILGLAAALALSKGWTPWLVVAGGAAVAIALLAKLSGLLLALPLAAALVYRPKGAPRPVALLVAAVVLACAAAALVFLPHEGSEPGPLEFQMGRLSEAGIHPLGPLEVAGAIIGLAGVLPAAGVLMLGRPDARCTDLRPRVLAWGFWPVISILAGLSLIIHVEANWGAVALPSLAAAWALLVERGLARRPGRWLALAWSAAGSSLALSTLMHLHAAGILAPSWVGKGPAARLHGWRTMAHLVSTSDPGPVITSDHEIWAALSRNALDLEVTLVADDGAGLCELEQGSWRVKDVKLGLDREILACRADDGRLALRSRTLR